MALAKHCMRAGLLAISCAAAAQNNPSASLYTAYQQALINDPTFVSAEQQLQAGLQSSAVAKAFLRPTVNLVGSVNAVYQDVSSDFFGGFNESYIGWSAQLQVSGPLWHRELKSILNRGENQETLAQTQFALAGQQLVQRLSDSYFELLAARTELDFAQGQVKSVDQELNEARVRFRAGAIARTGLDEARARSDLARAAVIDATMLVDNAEDALLEIIGPENVSAVVMMPDVPARLSPKAPQPDNLGSWLERTRSGNLEIMAARQRVLLQQNELSIAEASLSPRLDYSGQFGLSDQSQSRVGQERYGNEIALQLTVPIYAGGSKRANIRVAAANRATAEADVRRVQARVQLNTRRAFRQIQALRQRDEALAKATISAKSALRATRAGYDAGSRTVSDLLDAKTQLLSTQRDSALLRYEYLRAAIALQQLVGELGPQELVRLDGLLTRTNNNAMAQLSQPGSPPVEQSPLSKPSVILELQRSR